jgi:ethanolamine-phosphate phospho-lyase
MTVSGSEANDLAWRIAMANAQRQQQGEQQVQGRQEVLHVAVIDHAYHGHTSACIDISPYKFKGPGGGGRPAHVHVLPCPDVFRGRHLDGAAAARRAIEAAAAAGGRLAAFFSESILSCGGQVGGGFGDLPAAHGWHWLPGTGLHQTSRHAPAGRPTESPPHHRPSVHCLPSVSPPLHPLLQVLLSEGYLEGVYREMRAAGAVCVADEVQCGFGRVGRSFWAFELQGVVPDIVTFGEGAACAADAAAATAAGGSAAAGLVWAKRPFVLPHA